MQVGVYRMSNERIGCSLADAAATPAYMNYLANASASPPALHVVYINTSLETKAYAHEIMPTITCTSSNVVQTILQVGISINFCNYNLLNCSELLLCAFSIQLLRALFFFLHLKGSPIFFFSSSQAFAQVPNVNIWYGPDTYMGANIRELLQQMTRMTDEEIAAIHPRHNRDSIKSLLSHLHYYEVISHLILISEYSGFMVSYY